MKKIEEIEQFIRTVQHKSLWFIKKNYKPQSLDSFIYLLGEIKKHSTVKEYKKAKGYEQWLLQNSKEYSVK